MEEPELNDKKFLKWCKKANLPATKTIRGVYLMELADNMARKKKLSGINSSRKSLL